MSAELLTDGHCGFHGKLPARMDFVSGGLPPGFGPWWEAWLEQGLTTSRNALGADWADAYFAMPIWRFLLVPLSGDARHRPLAGAFMPSVDGAGRTYPLTVVAACTEPFDPDSDPVETLWPWHEGLEAVLLATLERGATFEAFRDRLAGFAAPCLREAETSAPAGRRHTRSDTPTDVVAAMAETANRLDAAFWCRSAVEEIVLARIGCRGLPAPTVFHRFMKPDTLTMADLKGPQWSAAAVATEPGGQGR